MIGHDYPGRFALLHNSAAAAVCIPDGWIWREHDDLRLATDPELPVLEIRSRDNRPMGWLLGYPIDPDDRRLLTSSIQLSTTFDSLTPESFEADLYRLGGRFAAVLIADKWQRYYPDAAGSLAAFVCSQRQVIASSPNLLRAPEPVEPDLLAALRSAAQTSGTWYPMGMSGYRGIAVLLPNHHVDLRSWQSHRHWPCVPIPRVSPRQAKPEVREIFDTLRSTIGAVAAVHPLAMDLTGGQDSRMLLAAALPVASNIEFRTNPDHSSSDASLSEGLARVFELNHNNSTADRRDRVLLRGYGGEVGRCFYWQKCPGGSGRPTAEQLLQAFGFPNPHPAMLAEADRWLGSLPNLDREAILDVAYIEHRLGTTMSHVLYNSDTKHRFALFPLNHRGIFQRMLSLPHEYRRRQQFAAEMHRLGSPLLTLFPVNAPHFIGWTKYKKYCDYLYRRRSMTAVQRAIVLSYCTRGRTLPRMLTDDLSRGPLLAIRHLRSA